MVAAVGLGLALPHWEDSLPQVGLAYETATAQAALAAIAGAMITLSGFVITGATLVIQTVQSMSPRLIGVVGHVNQSLVVVSLLTGTAVYALVVPAQIRSDETPRVSVTLAVLLVVADTAVLMRSLIGLRRFVTGGALARVVGHRMTRSAEQLLPADVRDTDTDWSTVQKTRSGVALVHSGRRGSVQSIDEKRLLRTAAGCDARVTLGVRIGQYVGAGAVLGHVHGLVDTPDAHRDRRLRRIAACVRVGSLRAIDVRPASAGRWQRGRTASQGLGGAAPDRHLR